ncbi:hypothetical protein [Altererythrobacter epoxidivorans]|uniref:hypothetical protein n=1 Tax=Altererythrobacter epoxidivorans TaxID=361183 RepID=UPI0012EE44B8|nr:hypothetical protein [Altererythrobacter epoxidivorans]
MSQYRPVGVFLVCLLAANFTALAAFFMPFLFDDIARATVSELISGMMFLSIFSLPITLVGGLTFGLGFLALARRFDIARSVAAMTGVGAVAGALYALSVMVLLGGLRESFFVTCCAGLVGGVVAAITWTVMQERHANA